MTFKKQFLLLVGIILVSAIILSTLLYFFKKHAFTEYQISHMYEQRKNEFNSIINTRKTLLIAIADSLTQNNEVHRAYKNDDREILIDNFENMWKTFQNSNLISEIHFFKSATTSFVNFSNVQEYNMDVEDVRKDISWVASTFTPSTHFLICRLFPGLRATYPIVIDNILYGSVSLGIDIQKINAYIKKTHPEVISYFILDDAKLKHSLVVPKYKALTNNSTDFKHYKVFDTTKDLNFLDLNERYIYKDQTLYSLFAIKDFKQETIGYFIFEDTLDPFIEVLFNYTLLYIIMFFILGFISVYVFWRLLNIYNKDIEHILYLLQSLTNKEFHLINTSKENNISRYNELQRIEEKIFKTSDDIEMYIELLSKEIEDYSDKALKDSLTDIFNRRALEDIGNKMLTKNALAFKSTSLILMDIDDFKLINDTYGHSVGDLALKQLSNNVKDIIRKDDLFVRYGGEEFLILVPNTPISYVVDIAEKIRLAIKEDTLSINHIDISFTVSIGVSESIESKSSLEELIQEADVNLYTAKNNGKNCVVI